MLTHISFHLFMMTWKFFPHYCPFARQIHWFQTGFTHKWPVMVTIDVFFHISWNKLLNKQSVTGTLRCHDAYVTWYNAQIFSSFFSLAYAHSKPSTNQSITQASNQLTFLQVSCASIDIFLCQTPRSSIMKLMLWGHPASLFIFHYNEALSHTGHHILGRIPFARQTILHCQIIEKGNLNVFTSDCLFLFLKV